MYANVFYILVNNSMLRLVSIYIYAPKNERSNTLTNACNMLEIEIYRDESE